MPISLDDLASQFDACCESFQGSPSHQATGELFALDPERLVYFGRVDAVKSNPLLTDNNGIAVNDPGVTNQAVCKLTALRRARED